MRSEFTSQGINQTLHRVYLQVVCEVSILTPFENIKSSITNQVLLVENVIVGNTPNTYYNLEGLTKENTIDIIEQNKNGLNAAIAKLRGIYRDVPDYQEMLSQVEGIKKMIRINYVQKSSEM